MKKTAFKTGTTLLCGVATFGTLLCGTLFAAKNGQTASAAEGTVTAAISVEEGNEILAGDTFTLSLTVSTTLDSSYSWSAVALYYTILDDQNGYTVSQYIDTDVEVVAFPEGSAFGDKTLFSCYDADYVDNPSICFSFATTNTSAPAVSIQESCTMKVKIKVKETTPGGTKIKFALDEEYKDSSSIAYFDENDDATDVYGDEDNFSSNDVTITVREKSTDNTLSSVVVGTTDTNTQTYSKTDETPLATTLSYDYNEATVLSSVNITPTANEEHATIYMAAGSTAPDPDTATPVTSGTATNITLAEGVRVVTVLVKAESGDTKTYTVTIVDKYVALSALDIEVGTKTDGVTKIGLREGVSFAPDTLTYTVDVPSDYALSDTGVKITPKVAEGHGISETVGLAGTNSVAVNNSVASASPVQVTGIADDDTLTVTVTASDNTTTKVYTITFKVWSVETGDITVQVQGDSKTYSNDTEKAEEKKIDYYFLLTDEAECKGKFVITAQDGIPVMVRASSSDTAEAYDANKVYAAGTYYIILTAPAGNTKEYVAVLSNMEHLELAVDSTYQFIFEETTGTGSKAKTYLRTYHEAKMTHGVDDKDFEKVVLGNIAPKTTINAFLSNISPSQLGMIRIYSNKGQLIYDCGADVEGIDKANYDKWNKYRISTSWYVQYGGTAENPLETVYISVLGDVNCDGNIAASDVSILSYHISGKKVIEVLEVRLAAYVTNSGKVMSKDVTQLGRVITSKAQIDDFLYKIETTEPTALTTDE